MTTYVATTIQGLEDVLEQEIKALGGHIVSKARRAIIFEGDQALMYKANYMLRTALRILMPIDLFIVQNETQLYKAIQSINWPFYFDLDYTFAINVSGKSKIFTHSQYVALKCKDAIVDQFRDRFGKRPNVNTDQPDFMINIHIQEDRVEVLLDSSGESLHKRGYKIHNGEAPLSEVLAAGMILLTEWNGEVPLYDLMCGSGTILTEASLIATRTPPQIKRSYFAFRQWKDYDADLWQKIQTEALNQSRPAPAKLYGGDKSLKAIKNTTENLENIEMDDYVVMALQDFERIEGEKEPGVIVMNPPYDERLKVDDVVAMYRRMGDVMKKNFSGCDAYVISSNIDALKKFGLSPARRYPLHNGPLECRMYKFELREGSFRKV